ncbi:class II fructose-bisphosphate aldolase [Vibrio hannami]|uniref:class II fructose-bisphosphate aldolase n=1 Tax=Vibrio hannami TaxID=2717094 RepID=UPI00240F90A1|nr:class II fructose-bisphosphate aldolase [Vibrio hannami]MDG3086225.1 class II fructose-bisphosphate aldolase [Vibrio hannami]
MSTNLTSLLNTYRKEKRCLAGFNINDIYDVRAMVLAANELNLPVMAMTYPPVAELNSTYLCRKIIDGFEKEANNKIYLHLDHSTSVDLCKQAIDDGYDSVMIDGSQHDLKTNIQMTREVVEYARSAGVTVEAEIGKIMGRDVVVKSEDDYLASVADVVALCEEAGPDIVAVGIGTAHGFTPTTPKIHFERLKQIYDAVPNPLVLHGGTGIPDEDIQKAITMGIAKINIGTIVHTTYMRETHAHIGKDVASAYPPFIMKEVIPQVQKVIVDRLKAVNSL